MADVVVTDADRDLYAQLLTRIDAEDWTPNDTPSQAMLARHRIAARKQALDEAAKVADGHEQRSREFQSDSEGVPNPTFPASYWAARAEESRTVAAAIRAIGDKPQEAGQ